MPDWMKYIAAVLGAATVGLILVALALAYVLRPSCGNEIVTRAESPSRHWDAVVYDRSCGATTGYSRQVGVVAAGRRITDVDPVFVPAQDYLPVEIIWREGDTLEIHYPQAGAPLRTAQHGPVPIRFAATLPDSIKWPR